MTHAGDDAERWRRVELLLDVMLASDPVSWPSILDERCSEDPALRGEVEALLARRHAAERFLDTPPAAAAAALLADRDDGPAGAPDPAEGRRVGAYRIVRLLGRGGMSRVYLAERADGEFDQQVALKLLRPGLDSDVDVGRFRAERQILASLNHPNVARLLDGGITDDGLPYLVLERVDGEPLDRYAAARELGVRERLALFLTVAEATGYAHRNLVVHRDLKLSNILVTADGTVKLLDFGLARLLGGGDVDDGQAPDATPAITRPGHRWMTPEYAAPEQVRGESVTTLTDVWQLGVVLYELLAGRLPFRDHAGSLHALEEAVLRDDPPPPSATVPRLRGDLDAIVLRALRKEPEARYASVAAMADDVRRHLDGRPVLARRQTAGYRARRYVARHRWGLGVAALLAVLVGAHVTTLTRDRARIRVALDEATVNTRRAEEVVNFAVGLFEPTVRGSAVADTLTARDLLRRGAVQARETAGQPVVQAQMLDLIGRIHAQLGDVEQARALLTEALAIRQAALGPRHADVATSLLQLAQVSARRDHDAALAYARQAYAMRRALFGDADARTTDALYWVASRSHMAGDHAATLPLYEQWIEAVSRAPSDVSPRRATQLASVASYLGTAGQHEPAERLARESLALHRALYGDQHVRVAEALRVLGGVLADARKVVPAESAFVEAIGMLRAAYPDGHTDIAGALRSYADVLVYQRRWVELEAVYGEAAASYRRFEGAGSGSYAQAMTMQAHARLLQGRHDGTEPLLREALRIQRAQFPDSSPVLARPRIYLGEALRRQGQLAEAESLLLSGYASLRDRPRFAADVRKFGLQSLTELYRMQGRLDEAARYRALREAAMQPAAVPTPAAPAAPPDHR